MAALDSTVTSAYSALQTSITGTLDTLFTANRLTGDQYAMVLGSTLQTALGVALEIGKQNTTDSTSLAYNQNLLLVSQKNVTDTQRTLLDKQILTEMTKENLVMNQITDIESQTVTRNTQSSNDTTLKTAQTNKINSDKLLVDQQKINADVTNANGLSYYQKALIQNQGATELAKELLTDQQTSKVSAETAKVVEERVMVTTQKNNAVHTDTASMAYAQIQKVNAEASFIGNQSTQLTASVADNRNIKTAQLLGDTIGTAAAGGLTITEDMFGAYRDLLGDIKNEEIKDTSGNYIVFSPFVKAE